MLIDEIKKENMLALKNKDEQKRAVLSVIINKYMVLGYEKKAKGEKLKDEDLIKLIQKTLKELEEERNSFNEAKREDKVKDIEYQMSLIEKYIPSQLSEEEIKKIILSLESKEVPFVMKYFKTNYNGRCDMSLVNKVLRSL